MIIPYYVERIVGRISAIEDHAVESFQYYPSSSESEEVRINFRGGHSSLYRVDDFRDECPELFYRRIM